MSQYRKFVLLCDRRVVIGAGVSLAIVMVLAILAGSAFFVARDVQQYLPDLSDIPPKSDATYIFGVHPLHNPQHLDEVYQPLVDYVNAHLQGARLELEASRNYAAYDEKLLTERKFHFALPNPSQMVLASQVGYRIFGQMISDDLFRGIIVVRADSGIREILDLKGKAVSYPAPTALAATMLPQYYLQTHGLNVRTDVTNIYVGSQESSIMSVYLGTSAAGGTWPGPWTLFKAAHPDIARDLVVRWNTESLPNNGLVVRNDVPEAVAARVIELMLTLGASDEGRRIMARTGVDRFDAADDATYQPVRDFLIRYQDAIGTVPVQ